MILGSCCIKKFIPEAVTCNKCGQQLKDICKRLKDSNYVCPTCTRFAIRIDNERKAKYKNYLFFWLGHKYHQKRFCEIIHDEEFITDLHNNGMPFNSKTLGNFMEYARAFYDFKD
jgi:hypothetical protein